MIVSVCVSSLLKGTFQWDGMREVGPLSSD